MFPRLLAKSSISPDAPRVCETLPGHLADVGSVASSLVEGWGDAWLTSAALPVEPLRTSLHRACRLGALLHDIGKANDHFQRMVRGTQERQALRHEIVGVWLLAHTPALMDWLFAGSSLLVRYAALCALAGHHRQLDGVSSLEPRAGSSRTDLWVLADHADVRAALDQVAASLELAQPVPQLQRSCLSLTDDNVIAAAIDWYREATRWFRRASDEERRFVALVKAAVIASDIAGSAIPRQNAQASVWAIERQRHVCSTAALEAVADGRVPRDQRRPFQSAVAGTTAAVTFVRAGCGSGKTVAAYLWAARHATGHKLFFCYPTTGTATEGFLGYVPPDQAEWELIHSRAEADLEEILANNDENAAIEAAERAGMLAGWDARVVVCTTDTVLGLVQNYRRGLFAFPSIANGAFVFDEIHQYDDRLFAALLRFLVAFRGAPTLLMTATLQPARLAQLEAALDGVGSQLAVVEGPPELEAIPRYRLRQADDPAAWSAVENTVQAGERVLWVANTVDRAVSIAHEAEGRGLAVLPYHSRYRYGDRLRRHRDVLEAFSSQPRGVVAVTTQVCEVSLDLSADLLISDLAPIPALVQRLGRLNRRVSEHDHGTPKDALFLSPPSALPYERAELDRAGDWLRRLGESAVSQADLSAAAEEIEPGAASAPVRSAWLDGGADTAPAPLRDAGVTIDVVRQEDAHLCHRNGRVDIAAVTRNTIPMLFGPVRDEVHRWQRLGTALLVPPGRIEYSTKWGARWRAKQ